LPLPTSVISFLDNSISAAAILELFSNIALIFGQDFLSAPPFTGPRQKPLTKSMNEAMKK
jgi:hypothetical protein